MVKIGKIYELHFGKDIFIKYKVVNIDYTNDKVELIKIENYSGSSEIEVVNIQKLYKKRKIKNW